MANNDSAKHAENLGRLWSNLLSLEVILRLCILRKRSQESSVPKLETLKEGDVIRENVLTSYDWLAQVINKFNSEFKKEDGVKDKEKIVRLRNALAHGRFISPQPTPMTFYKFGKPKNGKIKVEIIEEMTKEWFNENISFIGKEVRRLAKVYEELKKP